MKVAVVGVGLIGGSIVGGLARRAPDWAVVGFDPDERVRARGAELGLALVDGASEAVAGADLVILAPPIDRTDEACRSIADAVGPEAIVTDVGSAKRNPVEAGERWFGDRFVGGHPMAGSEQHGIDAADPDLFDGAHWIVTPTVSTASRAYSAVVDLVGRLGARPVAVPPDIHDSLVARLSHVPQLAASALVDVAASAGDREALLGLAGPGFRDVTRIAASAPDMWVAIVRANYRAVLEGLDRVETRLEELGDTIAKGRWDELGDFLADARQARLGLFAKPAYGGEPVELSMMVPDRPGVLAEVTTAAGKLGANIEDLRIIHSTEGGRGRLELVVAGQDPAGDLKVALEALGYKVEMGPLT